MMSFAPWTRPRRREAVPEPAADGVPPAVGLGTEALMARLAAGDMAALAELYRREAGPVYRYALALCGHNAGWAADATQDAFMALAVRPAGFDPDRGAIGAYLAGVARYAMAAQRRSLRLLEPLPDDDDGFVGGDADVAAGHDNPEAVLVRTQDTAQVWAALRALPAAFREAIVLVDLQERPYAEAAQIAGIALNTLRTRVHRARLKLAVLLGAADGSPT